MRLRTAAAEDVFVRAERARVARVGNGRTFRSVKAALPWYYESRIRVQSPKNLYLATAQTYFGQTVAIEMVEGGRGSDVEDVLATLSTIARALRALDDYGRGLHQVIELRHRDGKSQADIAKALHASQATISAWLGEAEGYLAGALRAGGVLV